MKELKLVYWTETSQYHVVQQKKNSSQFRSNCNAPEDRKGNGSDWLYKLDNLKDSIPKPTKDNICKECFKENEKEMIFYLVKLRFEIK